MTKTSGLATTLVPRFLIVPLTATALYVSRWLKFTSTLPRVDALRRCELP